MRSAGNHVGAASKLSSSKQQPHGVQVRIMLRWHETSAERLNIHLVSITVLGQRPKQVDPLFSFTVRRHITERGILAQ